MTFSSGLTFFKWTPTSLNYSFFKKYISMSQFSCRTLCPQPLNRTAKAATSSCESLLVPECEHVYNIHYVPLLALMLHELEVRGKSQNG